MKAANRKKNNVSDLSPDVLLAKVRELFNQFKQLQNVYDSNHQQTVVKRMSRTLGILRKEDKEHSVSVPRNSKSSTKLQRAFIEKYQISISRRSDVTFVIPKGLTAVDLLTDVHAVTLVTRGIVAVYPTRLEKWTNRPEFKKNGTEKAVTVTPIVKDSGSKTRAEQRVLLSERGLKQSTAPDLACAHAAYFALRGADLFDGNIIRVQGTKLYYGSGGLSEMDENEYINNCRYKYVLTASSR